VSIDQRPATGLRALFRHKQIVIAIAAGTALLGGLSSPASAQGLFGWGNFWGSQPGYSRPRAHPARPAVTPRPAVTTVRENPAPKETEKPAAKETPAPPAPPARTGSGVITITVSLNKQKLAVYSDGVAVLRSQVSTGRATPTGVFSIIQKDRWHHTDTGDSPFMQRITWPGIGMHQAAANGPAAPSSIRLPEPLAKQLWGMTKVGTRVIITNGEVTPAAIANGRLFARRKEPAEPAPELRSPAKIVESAHNAFNTTGRKREAARPASKSGDKPGDPALDAYAREPATSSEVVRSTYDSFDLRRARRTKSAPSGGAVAEIRALRPGPISVFISRREGKLFVRKGFEPIYNSPVSFVEPQRPLGTHVFTALDVNDDDSVRWDVVTVPTGWSRSPVRGAAGELPSVGRPSTAAEALDRVSIPREAVDRIAELMSPGASLIISDEGLGSETGTGTDFTVITR
jgi:lipoprotein-anchoring transpeptidase ErfK/SrfK